jgi:hypothetical protein
MRLRIFKRFGGARRKNADGSLFIPLSHNQDYAFFLPRAGAPDEAA